MIWNFTTAMELDDVLEKLQEIREAHGGKVKVAFDSDEESMQYPVLNISVGTIQDEEGMFVLFTDEEEN